MVKLSEFDVVLERTMVHKERVYVRESERDARGKGKGCRLGKPDENGENAEANKR